MTACDECSRASRGKRLRSGCRIAEALQCLWPDYPPVRQARLEHERALTGLNAPLYAPTLVAYGLALRPTESFSDQLRQPTGFLMTNKSADIVQSVISPARSTLSDDRAAYYRRYQRDASVHRSTDASIGGLPNLIGKEHENDKDSQCCDRRCHPRCR